MRPIYFQCKFVKFTQQLNACRCSFTVHNEMWSLTWHTQQCSVPLYERNSEAVHWCLNDSQMSGDLFKPLLCRLITSIIATEYPPLPFFSIVFLWRASHEEELSCTEGDFLLTTSWSYNHSCSYRTEETWQILISLLLSSECCLWIIIP